MNHIISALVENRFGTLNRVAGMFSARGFNLRSISIGETENPEISRMTMVTSGDEKAISQILKQLNRLIDTIKVVDLTLQAHVARELVLITISDVKESRSEIVGLCNVLKGKVLDIRQKSITMEIVGAPAKVDAAIQLFRPYGIKEITRSGTVAIGRSES